MASIITWLGANWMGILIALLAIDRALERLFPNATVLKAIDDIASKIVPPSA